MNKLLVTSVIRGSNRGNSHGGVYLVDVLNQIVEQKVDWRKPDIDWRGAGSGRGMRGVVFDGETIYIASSDELFACTPAFEPIGSWRNRYLGHCHEIAIRARTLYLTSTSYDSILEFDLDKRKFERGLFIDRTGGEPRLKKFDTNGADGPVLRDRLHLNNVFPGDEGLYVAGMRLTGLWHLRGESLQLAADLPTGTHNAQPFRSGVLFNDTNADLLRYVDEHDSTADRALAVPRYDVRQLRHTELDERRIARQGFARGLCILSDTVVAGGSSPSTITVWDMSNDRQLASANLTMDIRSAIHCVAEWPY